jgi:DNA-binding response OmpR family regulator
LKALVVDDDQVLADLLSFTLRREGFQVVLASDGEGALRHWEEDEPDLLLLDINLSRKKNALNGFNVCQAIRKQSNIPIILLTVRGEEEDIIRGLELGADDYILKPFSPRQLVARIKALLRRTGKDVSQSERKISGLRLEPDRRVLIMDSGLQIHLTPLEYRLLDYLMLNSGHILPFDQILLHVWGTNGGERDMLRQLVHRLRTKMETAETNAVSIESIPALGYGLVVPQKTDSKLDDKHPD